MEIFLHLCFISVDPQYYSTSNNPTLHWQVVGDSPDKPGQARPGQSLIEISLAVTWVVLVSLGRPDYSVSQSLIDNKCVELWNFNSLIFSSGTQAGMWCGQRTDWA